MHPANSLAKALNLLVKYFLKVRLHALLHPCCISTDILYREMQFIRNVMTESTQYFHPFFRLKQLNNFWTRSSKYIFVKNLPICKRSLLPNKMMSPNEYCCLEEKSPISSRRREATCRTAMLVGAHARVLCSFVRSICSINNGCSFTCAWWAPN